MYLNLLRMLPREKSTIFSQPLTLQNPSSETMNPRSPRNHRQIKRMMKKNKIKMRRREKNLKFNDIPKNRYNAY